MPEEQQLIYNRENFAANNNISRRRVSVRVRAKKSRKAAHFRVPFDLQILLLRLLFHLHLAGRPPTDRLAARARKPTILQLRRPERRSSQNGRRLERLHPFHSR